MPRKSPVKAKASALKKVRWIKPERIRTTGFYWIDDPRSREPYVVRVRYYGDDLAIDNCSILGGYGSCLFYGPLPKPPVAARSNCNA